MPPNPFLWEQSPIFLVGITGGIIITVSVMLMEGPPADGLLVPTVEGALRIGLCDPIQMILKKNGAF